MPLDEKVLPLYSASCMAVTLNQWTLDQWVSDLKEKIAETKAKRGESDEDEIDPQTRYPFSYDGYKNKLVYPTQQQRHLIYFKGETVVDTTDRQEYEEGKQKYRGGVFEAFTINEEEYKAARKAYSEETARLEDLFKEDLFKANGVENHPLRETVYSRAWSEGHSGGLPEVANVFNDLADILTKASKIIDPLAELLRAMWSTAMWSPEMNNKIAKTLADAGHADKKKTS